MKNAHFVRLSRRLSSLAACLGVLACGRPVEARPSLAERSSAEAQQDAGGAAKRAEALVQQLQSADASARGAAKLELMRAPSPEALALLVKLAPGARDNLRTNLLEILSAYKDTRKIPALILMFQPSDGNLDLAIQNQLVELGAPAAQPLMDSVPEECGGDLGEIYTNWVASVLGDMESRALPTIFAGLRGGQSCKQIAASEALLGVYVRSIHQPQLEPDEEIEWQEAAVLTQAAQHADSRISGAAYAWIDSLAGSDLAKADYAKFVEALIAAYQAKAPAETMVEIARLLSGVSSPRVMRFMRAAVHAPNAGIEEIASKYAAEHAPAPRVERKRTGRTPQTSEEKIAEAQLIANGLDSSDTPKLVKLLNDADPRVRAEAARSLGQLNEGATDGRDERERDVEHSIPALLKAFADSSAEVRAAAAQAVGEIKEAAHGAEEADPEIAGKLSSLLRDSDLLVVAAAARSLGQLRDASGVPALLPLARDENSKVRANAAWALSQIHDASVTCPLLSLLEDPDSEVRTNAARGLYDKFDDGKRCPGDVDALLTASLHYELRDAAYDALGKLKDPRAVEPLVKEIEAYKTRSVCPECVVLGKIGDKRAVAPMVKLVQERHGDIGLEAVEALRELKEPAAVPSITPLLRDARPGMRITVIRALGDLNGCESMNLIRGALTDEVAEVRAAAAEAAGKCKDGPSVDLLIKMLPRDVGPAAKALGDIGDKRAVGPLIACFRQKELWGRRFVAHALGQLHDPVAVELLIAGLHDDTRTSEPIWVGIESAWALGEIGDARAVTPLQSVVRESPQWGGNQVAEAAEAALKRMRAEVPARTGKP